MEDLKMAIYFLLAASVAPYLITQPRHVHLLLAMVCLTLFWKSTVHYREAMGIDTPTAVIAVGSAFAFFNAFTNCPLSWLSVFLHGDPSQVPASQRPTPISQWFSQPRQLIPPDSSSQAPAFVRRMGEQLKELQAQLGEKASELYEALKYQAMWEKSEAEKEELKAEIEALKGRNSYLEMEKDLYKDQSARNEARADEYAAKTLAVMNRRDRRNQKGECFGTCEAVRADLTRELADMTKERDDAVHTITDLRASIAATKAETDREMTLKDRAIADRDEIISNMGQQAQAQAQAEAEAASANAGGDPGQANLFAHIGAMDEKLSIQDAEITRLNGVIDARRYCCCGRCGPSPPGGPNGGDDGGDDHGNDDDGNSGPPQGGDAQPPAPANEPSGAPPCPVAPSSNMPPVNGAPSDDDAAAAAAPVRSASSTPLSSPISFPASPASAPPSPTFIPASPATGDPGLRPPTHGT